MTGESSRQNTRSVTLALLTYQRTDYLDRAVDSMVAGAAEHAIEGWNVVEVLVVDNNLDGSAEPTVNALDERHELRIRHVHESTPGIVPARNRALDEAQGDVLVFMDDDEVALPDWPAGLLRVMSETGAALVGGPVVTEFTENPPEWAIRSGFFDEDDGADGAERTWLSTCNLAIDLDKIRGEDLHYDPRYPHGEDVRFSRQAASRGLGLRWSATAKVKEYVQPERTTLEWRKHCQRISTNAWVRCDLDLDSSLKNRLIVVGKAVARLGQASALTAVGALRRDRAKLNNGLIMYSHVRGSVEAMVAHGRQTNATANPSTSGR